MSGRDAMSLLVLWAVCARVGWVTRARSVWITTVLVGAAGLVLVLLRGGGC